ncbi:MAG TPA: bifunctional diaminohydroxyphosphoribosylaminopyrimidine deaminase/5-amino-6-(5-phosphoribosylamino)uracil reductase RibD [Anaerohalosphaeraceae bacterium]|nr:bifunctional diaminohydroxyphosphoribosylaminopyrimidine deaminase/5-amino-6-(5-phosphoribosylamino)uracil reductase RibD [Anaerohalosphaeraceae bacterium]HQG04886.1 bifunctional diaminohydroxyphosphoribosylaminopyrimidine deaminase/5-amino-6-(5-phosphoribosylamino)uracil reductase RibD [Anaerohalosphaeraceae bacterium]HQI07421.1 bifunctional diaminohydroxyphosphoribosylaminopyrimidine deaminase/5-amino-6-(5-phosphoribosylamino)uracil reductase RibD [Anaerohalosphaeraceae bacterium]HQJ67679.1
MDAEQAMRRALELARRGLSQVEPNPAVGCVIVKDGQVIGEGWHRQYGAPHAEIEALEDCRRRGQEPEGAIVYVTLEPCCFTGKTGPCTQALLQAKVAKVVAAVEDPHPQVRGRGLQQLRQAGVLTEVGLCRAEAESLNAPFFKYHRTGRPWVILKWAQSIDGKMAWRASSDGGNWISNEACRQDVHRLRKKIQGIVTGIETILQDNPQLTVRLGEPISRPPVRIVLDSQLRIPFDCRVLMTQEAPTWVVTTHTSFHAQPEKISRLRQAGAEILEVSQSGRHCDLHETLDQLAKRGLQQILVEAGPTLQSQFLKEKLADEVRIYIAPLLLGAAGKADLSAALRGMERIELHQRQIEVFGDNVLISARL